GARQGIAFGLALLCAGSFLVSAAGPALALTPPGPPTGVVATAGDGSAIVTWSAPADNGGPAVDFYTVTATGAGAPGPVTVVAPATSTPVTGLTNGTAYTFTVTATNAAGTGLASAASNAVTPRTVPGVPTGVSAAPANASATISWSAPADN